MPNRNERHSIEFVALARLARQLEPNLSHAHGSLGDVLHFSGRHVEAIRWTAIASIAKCGSSLTAVVPIFTVRRFAYKRLRIVWRSTVKRPLLTDQRLDTPALDGRHPTQ